MRSLFRSVAQNAAEWMASPAIFLAAIGVIVLWLVLGPVYGYSDTWQLVVNTGTSVITFLMVFLLRTHKAGIRVRFNSSWMSCSAPSRRPATNSNES